MLTLSLGVGIVALLMVSVGFSQVVHPEIRQAIDAGDTDKAIELLQSDIEADPSYYVNYYLLGRLYYDLGRYSQAREQFQLALDRKSKHYESLYYLSRSLIELGEIDEAEKAVEKGLKKAKDLRAQFENGIGLIALARKQYQEADRAFRRALAESEQNERKELKDLENAPYTEQDRRRLIDSASAKYRKANAEYHINLGDANFYQGVPSLAVAEYEKALEVDTGSLEVYYHWAEACLEMKDYSCAIEKLNIVLTKDSTHANAWMRAGGIYFKAARSSRNRDERNQRYKEAIGSYKKYVELSRAEPDSSTVRVFFELAMAYSSLYGYEDAARYFEMVRTIPYEPRDFYFYYGKALWGIKDYKKGAEILLEHLDWVSRQDEKYVSSVNDAELYQVLGDCYFYRKPKDFDNAVRYYVKSLESKPEQKRILQNIAVAYHNTKSYAQAIEYYDKRIALGIDSTSASIYKNAGYCALNIANREDESEELDLEDEELSGFDEPDPDKNYFEVSIDYLKSYLEFRPGDDKVVLMVATTYLRDLADCANSVVYYEKLLTLDPSSCVAKKWLGYAYFGGVCNKNYTKALRYLRDAYTCMSNSQGPCADVDVVKWVAQCYHLRAVDREGDAGSDFKNAFEWYGKCLKCSPSDEDCKKGQDDTRFEF